MNHKHKNEEQQGSGTADENQEPKAGISKLPRLEMYAVLGLELGQKIYEKLREVEDSIEVLARQKARELKPEHPEENEQ